MLILSSGHVIILQMGIKNHNQIMYASWDMECERHTFLSFWAIFCPFTSPLTPKIKNWKKSKKNPWRYYPFTNVHHQWRSYGVWFLRYKAWQRDFFVIVGHFSPLMLLTIQKMEKKKKMHGDIIILHLHTINDDHMIYSSWDMECHRQNFITFWTIFCSFTPQQQRKTKFEN